MGPATPGSPSNPSQDGPGVVPTPRLRILFVEDNRDVGQVLTRLLARVGHEVSLVANMAEALELAGKCEPYDFLISDLNLPDGSGLELKRRLGAIPAIAVSGYSTEIDLQECLDVGFLELLAKPIEFSALNSAITRITRKP